MKQSKKNRGIKRARLSPALAQSAHRHVYSLSRHLLLLTHWSFSGISTPNLSAISIPPLSLGIFHSTSLSKNPADVALCRALYQAAHILIYITSPHRHPSILPRSGKEYHEFCCEFCDAEYIVVCTLSDTDAPAATSHIPYPNAFPDTTNGANLISLSRIS